MSAETTHRGVDVDRPGIATIGVRRHDARQGNEQTGVRHGSGPGANAGNEREHEIGETGGAFGHSGRRRDAKLSACR